MLNEKMQKQTIAPQINAYLEENNLTKTALVNVYNATFKKPLQLSNLTDYLQGSGSVSKNKLYNLLILIGTSEDEAFVTVDNL